MFSHVMIGANNVQVSKEFYDVILGTLGYKPGVIDEMGRCFYFGKDGVFVLSKPIDGKPACHGNGSTIGFGVENPAQADAWFAAGVASGGTACEDPPGLREGSTGKLYLAYLRDPSENKICALFRVE